MSAIDPGAGKRQPDTPESAQARPRTGRLRLGVVIPTRNSAATIASCLESILQNIPNDARDAVVVDSGSTDKTLAIVRQYGMRFETIQPGFVSRSRNVGAAQVDADVLAFIDSDCVLLPGWYEAVRECLTVENIGALGCRYELRNRPTWVERTWLGARGGNASQRPVDARYVPGGNLIVPRAVFAKLGGFDETVETGEDMQLCAMMSAHGYRVIECGTIRCQHLGEPRTLMDVYWRNRWHGRGARLRYVDGRIAMVTLATIAFAAASCIGCVGVVASARMHRWWPSASLFAAPLVPGVYAARYARRHVSVSSFLRLWLIYFAYFCGRSLALAAVVRRAWGDARRRPLEQIQASVKPSHRHTGDRDGTK